MSQGNVPVNSPYLSLAEIQDELCKRRSDPALEERVKDFFGEDFPDFIIQDGKPRAIVSRSIFSPTMEMRLFNDMLSVYKLEPLFLEYPGTFVSVNSEKRSLAKLRIFSKTKKGKREESVVNIVDFNVWEGKPMGDIKTIYGDSLVDFHHNLFYRSFPGRSITDITTWFNKVRTKYAGFYSLGYLALGIYHGVIFENYLLRNARESKFYAEKVYPSILEIERIFGLRPLIHPVLPLKDEDDDKWLHYSANSVLIPSKNVLDGLK